MFCYLTDCDSNLSQFDAAAKEDCLLQHLIVVRREIEKIYDHYLGEKFCACYGIADEFS
jgi:non-ribosomal peptide synthetase component E (peptide arylation enzyme)